METLNLIISLVSHTLLLPPDTGLSQSTVLSTSENLPHPFPLGRACRHVENTFSCYFVIQHPPRNPPPFKLRLPGTEDGREAEAWQVFSVSFSSYPSFPQSFPALSRCTVPYQPWGCGAGGLGSGFPEKDTDPFVSSEDLSLPQKVLSSCCHWNFSKAVFWRGLSTSWFKRLI